MVRKGSRGAFFLQIGALARVSHGHRRSGTALFHRLDRSPRGG
jgi:hypothetical protein